MFIKLLTEFVAGATPLEVPKCLKYNGYFGLFSGGMPILALLFVAPGNMRVPIWGVVLQITIGLAFAIASGVAWRQRDLSGRVLVGQGIVLALNVGTYVPFMFGVLSSGHSGRVSHTPGILALGMAYALRLIVDFVGMDESRRARPAPRLAIVGLLMGGGGDLLLLRMMFQRFGGSS